MNAAAFTNPTGNWWYEGPFHVHVTADTDFGNFTMSGVDFDGTIHRWGEKPKFPGRIEHHNNEIKLYVGVGNQPFDYVHNTLIIRICRPNGQLIWQNRNYEDVVMQQVKKRPRGTGPMFYYDGERIIGQIGGSGPWYQMIPGQEVRFSRHGTFRFTKAFKTLAYLDVTLPRKGWNPVKSEVRIRIPTGKCLCVFRSNYYLEWMNTNWLWDGFGYRPGYQPLREFETEELIGLLELDSESEKRVRAKIASSSPNEVREHLRGLGWAVRVPGAFPGRFEDIKSKLLA